MLFNLGETIICSIEVKDNTGVLTDPAISMTITTTDPTNTIVVDKQAMIRDAIGKYHYDFTPLMNASLGIYRVRYIATDGARITIQRVTFNLGE